MTDKGRAIVINDTIHIPFCHETFDVDQWRVGLRGATLLDGAICTSFLEEGALPENFKRWSYRDK
jgi:hypothetical protein